MQIVKSPTVRGLLERALLAPNEDVHDDHLKVTMAGHEALAAAPEAVAEVSTLGWRLTSTSEHRAGFTAGGTEFVVTTSGWPNSTSAELMAQRFARSVIALHARTPDKFERELARFNTGVRGAFGAIEDEALFTVRLLHPEMEGYASNVALRASTRR